MASEATFDVVVLPKNVGRDRPTDGDESSARRDGDETCRHDRSQISSMLAPASAVTVPLSISLEPV